MGNAVLDACRDIQAKLRAMAARLDGVDEADVTVDAGRRPAPGRPRRCPIRDVLRRGLGRLGGEVIGLGEMRKEAEPDHPLGGTAAFFEFNCTTVEVEVDRETGDVTIHRHVTVSDVGKALNPLQVRGRTRAPRSWASATRSWSTTSSTTRGRIRNLGAIDYRIPTSHGPAARDGERHRRERATGPGRTARRA